MARKPPVKVSDQEIVNAIEDSHGHLRSAANKLKISYSTLLTRMKHIPEAQRAKEDAIADMVGVAESNVWEHLLEGNFAASKFVLERLSREKWGSQPAQNPMTGDYPEPIGEE